MHTPEQLRYLLADAARFVLAGHGTVYEFYNNYCPSEVHSTWTAVEFAKLVTERIAAIMGGR